MSKIVVCPDSFKGTLSARDAAGIIAKAFKDENIGAEIVQLPLSDGGEGTVECIYGIKGGCFECATVKDAKLNDISVKYLMSGDTAFLEAASVIGLNMLKCPDTVSTTSYGVGQLINHAAKKAGRVVIGLGGSSTTDGGCGAAAVLGARFFDESGKSFLPTGSTLLNIKGVDISAVRKVDITLLCDVLNPLYGFDGAAYMFAPQKGAGNEDVAMLDEGLRHLANIFSQNLNADVSALRGGGAAGGIAAGLYATAGAKIVSGIEYIKRELNFDNVIEKADLVISGEGKLDSQSLSGKVIDGVAYSCRKAKIPMVVAAGISEMADVKSRSMLRRLGIVRVY